MAQDEHSVPGPADAASGDEAEYAAPARRRVRLGKAALVVVVALILASVPLWLMRKDIADDFIESKLQSMGLPATYEIARISPEEQIVRNLVVGDPLRPDLTVAELRVKTRLFWGIPGIGRITVVRPRLYGTYHKGRASFGSLDKVLFTGSKEPFEMPDLDLRVIDGRALMDTDFGRFGVKLAGQGPLRDGFAGELAAVTPALSAAGCKAGRTSLYGQLTISDEHPRFEGPVRTLGLACADKGVSLARAAVQADLTLDKALDGGEGRFGLALGAARYGANAMADATGGTRFAYRKGAFSASYDLAARRISTPQAHAARLFLSGRARASDVFARFDIETDLRGTGLAVGDAPDRVLKDVEKAGAGTLVAPLAGQLRTALGAELRGSSFDANVIVRRSDEGLSLVAPRASLRGGSGASLLALSRLQALLGSGAPRITGNFATGGRNLPQAWGRMEADSWGRISLRASMNDYHAGDARLAVPRLDLAQERDGALTFTGQVALSGALPGGQAQDLRAPIEGRWAANGDLAVWTRCTDVAFEGLRLASLSLERRKLTICPAGGRSVVASRNGAFIVAAGVSSLDLAGKLGATPIRIASGPVGYGQSGGQPGVLKAAAIRVALGPEATASHFAISKLDARVGKDIAGTFDEADLGLYAVPLDLRQTAGNWRYAGGVLAIENARFTLVDRQQVPRFQPMAAQGASLRLVDNVITAQALLREPTSQRAIVRADIVHDLGKAVGHAGLTVDGIVFDDRLQASQLSALALGVASNIRGTVTGTGRIDWTEKGVTSRGRLATTGLDFAAAFGPLKGLSGQVVFTDLLGLVTAADQKLRIASINPGIEVNDGVLSFQMEPKFLLRVNGARWPFMDGELTLDPTTMQIGVAETRHYTLRVAGLNAGSFIQRMEVSNINATGTFDGVLPLVFDQNGGRIDNGALTSRPPGGSVAYNGALTYKDLSAMGNFAFDALRDVRYKQMQIGLGGSLSGDIVTRISFDGLSQGTSAKRNFITKQVAKLPIRFIVNIKAPFFTLFTSVRSLYDPSYVDDPRRLGLVDDAGHARVQVAPAVPVHPVLPQNIQPPVSENER